MPKKPNNTGRRLYNRITLHPVVFDALQHMMLYKRMTAEKVIWLMMIRYERDQLKIIVDRTERESGGRLPDDLRAMLDTMEEAQANSDDPPKPAPPTP